MDERECIFVAGGTGMVGSAVIRRLLSSGFNNIISSYHRRLPDPAPPAFPGPNTAPAPPDSSCTPLRWVRLDLTRQADTEAFFAAHRPERVFLSAAKVGGILANNTYRADFIYDNLAIAANVISCSHRFGVKKLVNLGSSCIYPRLSPQPVKEEYLLTGPLEPTNEPYAVAKIAAIKLCRYFNEQYGTNFLSAMPTNLYGPMDNFNLETSHVLAALLRKFHLARLLQDGAYGRIAADIKRHSLGFGMDGRIDLSAEGSIREALEQLGITAGRVTVWGTGTPRREFLHVDDLAEALLFLMNRCNADDIGEFVNIGSGKDTGILDIADMVKGIAAFSGDLSYDATKPDGMPRKVLDVSLARRLGWEATIPLEEGIRSAYQWYRGLS